jgi:hypothetical protein
VLSAGRALLPGRAAGKDHSRALLALQRMLAAFGRMAVSATARASVHIGVLPFKPESFQKEALVVGCHVNGMQKIPVDRRHRCRRGVCWADAVAEIAQNR